VSLFTGLNADWFHVRGIPFCVFCELHRQGKPGINRVFPLVGGDNDLARAYFGLFHLSHGQLEGLLA